MRKLERGRYAVRTAASPQDISRAQALRHLCFRGGPGVDRDDLDPICMHVLIEERERGRLMGCFRVLPLSCGAEIDRSYAARVYDLSGLSDFDEPMAEIGRFCIHPDVRDVDVLRVAWGALAVYVEGRGIQMLFGCASFPGIDWTVHAEVLTLLQHRHVGPTRWLPGAKTPDVVRFADRLRGLQDPRAAIRGMPPLLRFYLTLGGWVSDHAVVDREMNTLHVFTAVEIRRIPPGRKRVLQAVAG